MMQSIDSGMTERIKNSNDPEEKKAYFYIVENKAHDSLFRKHKVDQDEISFAARFYKIDKEPSY